MYHIQVNILKKLETWNDTFKLGWMDVMGGWLVIYGFRLRVIL